MWYFYTVSIKKSIKKQMK